MTYPSREQALEILHEYTKSDSLRKHAIAVEAVMKAFAEKHGDDPHKFALVGLLHDFDYEVHPTVPDHPLKGSEILRCSTVSRRKSFTRFSVMPIILGLESEIFS